MNDSRLMFRHIGLHVGIKTERLTNGVFSSCLKIDSDYGDAMTSSTDSSKPKPPLSQSKTLSPVLRDELVDCPAPTSIQDNIAVENNYRPPEAQRCRSGVNASSMLGGRAL